MLKPLDMQLAQLLTLRKADINQVISSFMFGFLIRIWQISVITSSNLIYNIMKIYKKLDTGLKNVKNAGYCATINQTAVTAIHF